MTGSTWQSFCELYDPATNLWSAAASALYSPAGSQAALLPNGKVIDVGGYDGGSACLAVAELYDPTTNTWTLGPPMAAGRCMPSLTTLANGKVLVAGGLDSTAITSAELYDAATNTGGAPAAGASIAATALYDPPTNTWSPASSMITARRKSNDVCMAGVCSSSASGSNPTDSGGCGCRVHDASTSGGLPAALALVLLRLRRRRGRCIMHGPTPISGDS